jgi:hypothetical protein
MPVVLAQGNAGIPVTPVVGERDWFRVPWKQIHEKTGLPPYVIPGVREPKTGGQLSPWPRYVHRTHLPALGLVVPVDDAPSPHKYGEDVLRSYQKLDRDFVSARRGVILSQEQRVGKTPTAMYAHEPNDGMMVVVGPLASRLVWHEWAARRFGWCADETCITCSRLCTVHRDVPSFIALEGRTVDPKLPPLTMTKAIRCFSTTSLFAMGQLKPRVVFMSHAIVFPWSEQWTLFEPLGTLVVDEFHMVGLGNRHNLTVKGLRRINTVASRAIMLSGTPISNRIDGLWAPLDIAVPGAFGKYWDFGRRWVGATPGAHGYQMGAPTRVDELKARLSEVLIRRTWKEIAPNLPPISRSTELVAIPEKVRWEVEQLASELRKMTDGLQTKVGHLARLRRLFAEAKTDAAVLQIEDAIANGHSCIGWVWHRDVAFKLVEKLRAKSIRVFDPIHGQVPPKEREEILRDAASGIGPRVLVATMASLGTAVALTWASHEFFAELDWNPTNIAQPEMRPFDGVNSVSSVFMVADCDSDIRLAQSLVSKLGTTRALGLEAGVGSCAEVLGETFGIAPSRSLDEMAERLLEARDDE